MIGGSVIGAGQASESVSVRRWMNDSLTNFLAAEI